MKLNLRNRRWSAKEEPDSLWDRLNEAWRDLITLTTQINRATQTREVVFTGPIATLSFSVDTDKRPAGVSLVSLYRTDTGATSAVTFSWTYADGQVSTISFAAVAAAEWRATFQIIGGE
jgi:hypothetical protein